MDLAHLVPPSLTLDDSGGRRAKIQEQMPGVRMLREMWGLIPIPRIEVEEGRREGIGMGRRSSIFGRGVVAVDGIGLLTTGICHSLCRRSTHFVGI